MHQDKASVSGDFKVLDLPNIYSETAIANFDSTWIRGLTTSEHELLNGSEVIIEEDENETSSAGL
jgi:hypothetical protein